MINIVQVGKNTKELFSVHIAEDGSYFAIREESPFFALHGNSITAVCAQARNALDFYRDSGVGP